MQKGSNMKKVISVLLSLMIAGGAMASTELDFSSVDSRDKAIKMVEQGTLQPMFLFPIELGGQEAASNVVFVPVGIPDIQNKLTGTIIDFAQEGLIDSLQVSPEYKGDSFVPSKINITTSLEGKSTEFNPVIDIW